MTVSQTSRLEGACAVATKVPWSGSGVKLAYLTLLALAVLKLWLLPLRTGLWLDETGTYWAANGSLAEAFSRPLLWPSQFPLYSALAWLMLHLGGPPEIMLRLPSIAAMGLGTFLLFQLGVRIVNRGAAWIAAVLFVGFEPVAFAAADARSYAIGLMASIGAMLMLVRWIDSGRMRHAIGYVLFGALTWHMQYVFATTFLVHLIYLLYRAQSGAQVRRWQVLLAASMEFLLLLPSAPHLAAMARTATSHGFAGTAAVSDLVATLAPPGLICGLLAGAALVWALDSRIHATLPRVYRADVLLLATWAGIPSILLFGLAYFGTPLFLPRYILPFFPALALIAGAFASAIQPARWQPVIAALALAGLVFSSRALLDFSHGGDWRRAIRAARAAAGPDGDVLIRTGFPESEPFNWLGDSKRMEFLFAPLTIYKVPAFVPLPFRMSPSATVWLDGIVSSKPVSQRRLVLVAMGDPSYDQWLAGRLYRDRFVLRRVAGFGGPHDSLRVVLYEKQ